MRWLKPLGLSLLALVVLLTTLLVCSLSPWGSRLVLSVADQLLEPLTIDYQRGGLASRLQLSRLRWQQDDFSLEVEDLHLQLDLSCWWRMALCVDSLSTRHINVDIRPAAQSNAEDTQAQLITMPVPISVNALQLGSMALHIRGQLALNWQQLEGKLSFADSLLVERLALNGLQLDLAGEPTNTAESAGPVTTLLQWPGWQYQVVSAIAINVPLKAEIKNMELTQFSLSRQHQPLVALNSVQLSANISPEQLQLTSLTVAHAMGQLQAQGLVNFEPLLAHQLSVEGQLRLAQQAPLSFSVASQGSLEQLELQAAVNGDFRASLRASAQLTSPQLPIQLQLNWHDMQWPLLASDDKANTLRVKSVSGQLSANGLIDDLALNASSQLAIEGLPVMLVGLDARLTKAGLQLTQLTLDSSAGNIAASGDIALTDRLQAQLQLNLQQLNPGWFQQDYQALINGQIAARFSATDQDWQATLSQLQLAGSWRGMPLSVGGEVQIDSSLQAKFQQVRIINGDNSVVINGQVDPLQQVDISMQLHAPELAQSLANIAGQLDASAQIIGSLQQPKVALELRGQSLSVADIQVAMVEGQGQLVWDDVKPVDLQLSLSDVQGNNNQLDSLKLSLTGNAGAHQLQLDTSGQQARLLARISGQLAGHSWTGQWLEGDVRTSYANLKLLAPFAIEADWQAQRYTLESHCWQHEQSDLCIKQASYDQQVANWDVALHELNLLPLFQRFYPDFPPLRTSSKLNMQMQGQWRQGQAPSASLHASMSPASWTLADPKSLALELDGVELNGQLNHENVSLQLKLAGPEIGQFDLALQGQGGVFAEPLERPISGQVSFQQVNLAPFKVLLSGLDKLAGQLQGQASISGTLAQPLLNGDIVLSDGALQGQDIPLIISGVNQTISLQGNSATLEGNYQLGKGVGTIQGEFAWQPEIRGNLQIDGDALEFDYQTMLRAKVSPHLALDFNPQEVKLSGQVSVPYARFKLRDLPADTISPSKDVVLVEQQQQLQQQDTLLKLDLTLLVDPERQHQVKVDAFGLTTDVAGKLHIGEGKGQLQASGSMHLINGRYRAYGQNLLIRDGFIAFNGPISSPQLNIEAIRDPKVTADEVIAGLRVDGMADNPRVEVFAEPAMEQQQSLAYLLTGRGLGQSSGDSQDTALTNMLIGFGLSRSENVISNVGQKLGIKQLNLDTSGQGDSTQLSLTGYIAPGVQLRYGVGVFDSVSEVAIRYELLPQMYIEAVSGLNNAIDIYYRFSVEGKQAE